MSGTLHAHRGTLWVGWHEKTAHVAPFDWNGKPLAPGFSFRDARIDRSTVGGIALDDDRNLWVADTACSRVRRFSVFGRELGGIGLDVRAPLETGPDTEAEADAVGRVRRPTAVHTRGDSDGLELLIGSGGTRRHALQLFTGEGALVSTLRPLGDAHGRFRDLVAVDRFERLIAVVEREANRVQVFRDDDFHFAFRPADGPERPVGIALFEDGHTLVCGTTGVHRYDPAGRRRATLIHALSDLRADATATERESAIDHPLALALDPGDSLRTTRLAILDRDATRIQIYDATGRHYGSFSPVP